MALSLAAPVVAQTPAPPPTTLAMAAGYKALTVCSAVFTARDAGAVRTVESVEAHELVGIYPELDPLIHGLKAEIVRDRVSVDWSPTMPPRIAVHRPHRGCSIMPVGWAGAEEVVVSSWDYRPPADLVIADPSGDASALTASLDRAFAGSYGQGTDTTAVVILQNSRVVAERYAEGFGPKTPQRTWSVAKSLAGTLIGAAVQNGEARVEAPAAIADWRTPGDPRAAITLDNLMRMASGLTSDTAGNRTDAVYFGGVGVDEQVTAWPLIAMPGTRFRYANNDILLAVLSLGPSLTAHSPLDLFESLGMANTTAETDWRGNYILSSQVWTTARDLARFGQLYLDDGVVNGRRVLPESWRTYVSTPKSPQPEGEFGYGATFWLMNRSEGVPPETFAAFGNRGQYVVIVPSRNVVIVRRAEDPTGKRFDVAGFTRDVLAALH